MNVYIIINNSDVIIINYQLYIIIYWQTVCPLISADGQDEPAHAGTLLQRKRAFQSKIQQTWENMMAQDAQGRVCQFPN